MALSGSLAELSHGVQDDNLRLTLVFQDTGVIVANTMRMFLTQLPGDASSAGPRDFSDLSDATPAGMEIS